VQAKKADSTKGKKDDIMALYGTRWEIIATTRAKMFILLRVVELSWEGGIQ